jgi:hypothetical protein
MKQARELEAVRQVFNDNKTIAVTRDDRGFVRIRIGTVRGSFLQTRIPMFKLDQREQYDPETALSALEITNEFESAVDKLHLFNMPVLVNGPVADPEPNSPHLPSTMKDVTIDHVLTAIAKTFGGIIAYGECVNPVDNTPCISLIYIPLKEQ